MEDFERDIMNLGENIGNFDKDIGLNGRKDTSASFSERCFGEKDGNFE